MRQPNLSGWCAFFGLLLMIGVDLRPGSATGKEERADGPGALPGVRCAARAGTALEILGSGGPMHREARGSAAYLLWHRGRPAAVVDMGGDTAMALARAGVDAGEIDTLLISHFHPDHVSGLPDFLWGEIVSNRDRPLTVVGPSGTDTFPALETFLARQFGEQGSFPFMSGLLSGEEFELETRTVDVAVATPQLVAEREGLRFSALGVPHGRTPALAFRIDGPNFRVVLSGDQTARLPAFSRFARNADVLVAHAMITDAAARSPLSQVVALPGVLGAQALESAARHVVLGHLMGHSDDDSRQWSLSDLDDVYAGIREYYTETITLASDGLCVPLMPASQGDSGNSILPLRRSQSAVLN